MSGSASQPDATSPGPFAGRKILVALCGGIACYKVATVVSRLVQAGANVRVMMTDAATKFVTPLTFQSLSGQPVVTSIWESVAFHDSQHIGLARWCDLMILAPASADIIAKIAAGFTDDIVSLTVSALPRGVQGISPAEPGANGLHGDARSPAKPGTPLLLAPAMNADMWASPIVARNLQTLKELLGVHTVGPDEGWQACRTKGAGRMSEPEAIVAAADEILAKR